MDASERRGPRLPKKATSLAVVPAKPVGPTAPDVAIADVETSLAVVMPKQPFVFCDGPHDGPCPNRLIRLMIATAEQRVRLTGGSPADSSAQIVEPCLGGPPVSCKAIAGRPCPFKPSYNKKTRELSVCGKVVRSFRGRCKQTDLLEAFESRHWPESIEDPLGAPSALDAENGLRDIICELNKEQHVRPWVHFWRDDRTVHWEIAGDEPGNQ